MRILITGVCGFIGERLAGKLHSLGHEIVGCGRQKSAPGLPSVEYHAVDVLDPDAVLRLVAGCDAVVHLAALTAHKDIVDDRFGALDINLRGTKNILDAVRAAPRVRKFVYSSTGKVYGDFRKLPIGEDEPTRPLNILGKSKLIAERLIDFYALGDARSYVALRIFNVYGPGQKANFLVPTILAQLDLKSGTGARTVKLGDIKAARDYTYVDDVIDAFALVLAGDAPEGFSVYNVASGIGVSAGEIVETISGLTGIGIGIDADSAKVRSDELDAEYGDNATIKAAYGWQPRFSLRQGLEETIGNMTCKR